MGSRTRRRWLVLAILATLVAGPGEAAPQSPTSAKGMGKLGDPESSTVAITSLRMYHLDPPKRRTVYTSPPPDVNRRNVYTSPPPDVNRRNTDLTSPKTTSSDEKLGGVADPGSLKKNRRVMSRKMRLSEDEVLEWANTLSEERKQMLLKKLGCCWCGCIRPCCRRKCMKSTTVQLPPQSRHAEPPPPMVPTAPDNANLTTTATSTPTTTPIPSTTMPKSEPTTTPTIIPITTVRSIYSKSLDTTVTDTTTTTTTTTTTMSIPTTSTTTTTTSNPTTTTTTTTSNPTTATATITTTTTTTPPPTPSTTVRSILSKSLDTTVTVTTTEAPPTPISMYKVTAKVGRPEPSPEALEQPPPKKKSKKCKRKRKSSKTGRVTIQHQPTPTQG